MSLEIKTKTTKRSTLAKNLILEIEKLERRAHAPFLSENEIRKKYNVSKNTARGALQDIEDAGQIYRIHGKGAFITPAVKSATLLFIYNDKSYNQMSYTTSHFLNGLITYNQKILNKFSIIPVHFEQFKNEYTNMEFHYHNVSGIIVLGDIEILEKTKHKFASLHLPVVFYGSDTWQPGAEFATNFYYKEKDLITTGVSALQKEGYKKIAFFYSEDQPVQVRRKEIFLEQYKYKVSESENYGIYAGENNFVSIRTDLKIQQMVKQVANDFDAIFCAVDWIGSYIINFLCREGVQVPEKIGVAGINNHLFCLHTAWQLSAVGIPYYEDSEKIVEYFAMICSGKQDEANLIQKHSDIQFYRRESTMRRF